MANIATDLQLGAVYGWGNISCVMFGSSLVGFESIEWKKTQKKEHVYGVGREPRGTGYGNKEYTGTIEILYDELIKIINSVDTSDITDVPPFTMTVWFQPTTQQPLRKVKLINVEFMESPFKSSQGETSIKLSLPLLIGQIDYI